MKNISSVISALGLTLMGCASIVSGSRQKVSFDSSPRGATVTVNGNTVGQTPVTVPIGRKANPVIQVEKPGYKPAQMTLGSGMNPWFWGNIIIGGVFGSTTDAGTGAVKQYSPDKYMVTLYPLQSTPVEGPPLVSKEGQVRDLVLSQYADIKKDLAAGAGPNLDSLMGLLAIPTAERPDAVRRMRTLTENFDAQEFSDRVIQNFLHI